MFPLRQQRLPLLIRLVRAWHPSVYQNGFCSAFVSVRCYNWVCFVQKEQQLRWGRGLIWCCASMWVMWCISLGARHSDADAGCRLYILYTLSCLYCELCCSCYLICLRLQ